jgi:hypothetical protein
MLIFFVSFGVTAFIILVMAFFISGGVPESWFDRWQSEMVALTGCCFGAGCAMIGVMRHLHLGLRRTLQTQDTTAIGSWVEVLVPRADVWPGIHKILVCTARESVIACLSDMKEGDSSPLSLQQRGVLYRSLAGTDVELIRAVLQALPSIGDEQALPYVQALALGTGKLKGNEAIRMAAQGCLPLLQANLALKLSPQTLLRASSVSDTKSEELLHPAQDVGASEAQQLLRAHVSDGPV